MHKILMGMLAAFLLLFPAIGLAAPGNVGSNDLIENAKAYDGQEIIYTGEVIGDVMVRGDHAWVNVSDGSNAIGVWIQSAQANSIRFLGSHKAYGDTVRVTGIFHRACAEHGGDLDIHATSIEVVQSGCLKTTAVSPLKAGAAIALFGSACLYMIILWRLLAKP